jgi:Two component regulator propeller
MYNNTIPFLWVTGLNFDNNSNLWNLVSWSPYIIQVLKKDGSWRLLDFSQFTYFNTTVSKVIFTKNNQAWVILARDGGVLIYSDVNGLSAPNASNTKVAKIGVGIGNLPTSDVPAICEDLDGKIWIGTQKGVAVFYNPENVFTGANWDCQQILIEQDGNVQNLLEDDKVNAVAVDGANRKWIGTENSGVYCFSPDGQNEIYHFTFENSPLYSNAIRDIVTDETTGDVFIASEAGIQSFRTPIIKGFDNFSKVHAYPNPVRPGTSSTVYVKGLVDEAIVKITDVAGNLIWETKAQGGQIQWNLQNFRNEKVVSGTYLINCSTANGELKGTTKLLIVN